MSSDGNGRMGEPREAPLSVTLGSPVRSEPTTELLLAAHVSVHGFWHAPETVGETLALLPTRIEPVRRGADSVDQAIAAAWTVAAGAGSSDELVPARYPTAVLVDGAFEGSRFILYNGVAVQTLARPRSEVALDGAHVWALLEMIASERTGALGLVSCVEPYEGWLFLPQYEGLSTSLSYARSRMCRVFSAGVTWPADHSEELQQKLRAMLWCAHGPSNRAGANNLENPEFVDALTGYFDDVLPREVSAESKRGKEPSGFGLATWPAPRLVKTAEDAEAYAVEVMRALGFADAAVTPPGADGGVDVCSRHAVAQVKMEGVRTSRPVVQALAGAAFVENKKGFFFSLAGYTSQALEWAELAQVACFEFAYDGSVRPMTSHARELAGESWG